MSISRKLSELLSHQALNRTYRETGQGLPWTIYRLISPSFTTAEVILAIAVIINAAGSGGLLSEDATKALLSFTGRLEPVKLLPNPALTLAIVLLVHKGGSAFMSIIEKVMQPLLNARYETGHAEGRTEGLIEGLAEGRTEGLAEGRTEGLAEGRTEGLVEGRTEGLAEGLAEGRTEGLAEGLAEGRTEERSEWRDWLNRKTRAEIDGQPFDEPAPDEKR